MNSRILRAMGLSMVCMAVSTALMAEDNRENKAYFEKGHQQHAAPAAPVQQHQQSAPAPQMQQRPQAMPQHSEPARQAPPQIQQRPQAAPQPQQQMNHQDRGHDRDNDRGHGNNFGQSPSQPQFQQHGSYQGRPDAGRPDAGRPDAGRPGFGSGPQHDDHRGPGPGGWQGGNANNRPGGYRPEPPHRDPGHWQGRPSGHGDGWGGGPRYRPGFVIYQPPPRRIRVPYRGVDFFYSDGYWYQPRGSSYVVVEPPYGMRVSTLPDYSQEVWINGDLYFLAAGSYYQWQGSDYVVVQRPMEQVSIAPPPPQPVPANSPYEPVAYAVRGQSPEQFQQDHYDCYRYAVGQSAFDPAQATYAPAPQVAGAFRSAMAACYAGRGYRVN